jgi:membrane-associated phospholipid phosphatase
MTSTDLDLDTRQDRSLYKVAKLVSAILHPMTLSSVAFFLLIIASNVSTQAKLLLVITATFFSSIVPILFIYTQKNWINTDERAERLLPLIVGIVSYFAGFLVLMAVSAPIIIQALMFCYATNTLIVLLITVWWKVSVHTTAASGPLVALTYSFGSLVFPFYLIIPLVGLSRLILKKHTILQVIVGMLIGIIGTAVQVHYGFKVPFPSLT